MDTPDTSLLVAQYHNGQYAEVERLVRQQLAQSPGNPVLWNLLAASVAAQGRNAEALKLKRFVVDSFPDNASAHNNLGNALLQCGLHVQAEAAFRQAIALEPGHANAHYQLGLALYQQHRLPESWRQWQGFADQAPQDVRFLMGASLALLHIPQQLDTGLAWLESRLPEALLQTQPTLRQNLGALYMRAHGASQAEKQFRAIVSTDPTNVLAWVSLGNAQKEQGQAQAALGAYQQALLLDPQHADAASQACFVGNLLPSTPEDRRNAAQRFGTIIAQRGEPFSEWHCTPQPDRLVVGLMSGDWYCHPVAFFLKGVLQALPRDRLHIVGYQTQTFTDAWTTQLRALCDHWQDLSHLDDNAAAHQIHADAPHLLLDLSGHTAYHRLGVMALRPAPVQASWLGYFASTGVGAVDYLLVDATGAGKDFQLQCTERLWLLPDTRLCFTPPASAPAVVRRGEGPMVFGSFAQLTKVTDDVLVLWTKVMAACPEARLRIQSRLLQRPEVCSQLGRRLAAHGLSATRVDLVPGGSYVDYLAAYAQVDVVLDTFPYTGGTTTCEALWMGVPTITLAGDTLVARQGASLLTAAGLTEWITNSQGEFVAKAVQWSNNRPGLSALRLGLREQLGQTALFDATRFVTHLESALWGMWREKAKAMAGLRQGSMQ